MKVGKMNTDLVCVNLAGGIRMPTLAYSVCTGEIGGTTVALETALKAGYRHVLVNTVDKNELEVGHVIRRWTENKKLTRQDFFISVKISFEENERINLKSRFVQTLYTLDCEYVDLLILDADSLQCANGLNGLLHQNDAHSQVFSLWKTAVALLKEGSVRALGLTCNDDDLLHNICNKSDVPPHVFHINYCDMLNTRTFQTTAGLCRKHSVQALIDIDDLERVGDVNNENHDRVLGEISQKTDRSQEQVLVRSCMERGMAVVGRFPDRKTIQKSFQVYDFEIQRKDLINLFRTAT